MEKTIVITFVLNQ